MSVKLKAKFYFFALNNPNLVLNICCDMLGSLRVISVFFSYFPFHLSLCSFCFFQDLLRVKKTVHAPFLKILFLQKSIFL